MFLEAKKYLSEEGDGRGLGEEEICVCRALAARFTPVVRCDVKSIPSALHISKLFLHACGVSGGVHGACDSFYRRCAAVACKQLLSRSFSPRPRRPSPMLKALPLHRARHSRARMAAAHTAPCLASEPWSLRARHCHSRRTDRRSLSVRQDEHEIEDGKARA